MKKRYNNSKGFSLLELMVSVGIFSLVLLMATGIFQSVVRGQQSAIASQDTQESLRYVYEVMGKEIRNAQKGSTSNTVPGQHLCVLDPSTDADNRVFATSSNSGGWGETSDIFYFKDKYDNCVYYYLVDEILMVHRNDMAGTSYTVEATPASIEVTAFDVAIHDNLYDAVFANWIQPYVTVSITAKAKGHEFLDNETKMQTTISSRMYE